MSSIQSRILPYRKGLAQKGVEKSIDYQFSLKSFSDCMKKAFSLKKQHNKIQLEASLQLSHQNETFLIKLKCEREAYAKVKVSNPSRLNIHHSFLPYLIIIAIITSSITLTFILRHEIFIPSLAYDFN